MKISWASVGKIVGRTAPVLGGILGGPVGGAAGELIAKALGVEAKPEIVSEALKKDPLAAIKLAELASAERVKLQELAEQHFAEVQKLAGLELQAELDQVKSVNETMREELKNSANEDWYQKAWRPFNGFVVGLGSLAAVLFTCYLFYKALVEHQAQAFMVVPELAASITMILAVPGAAVGITAWGRNKLKMQKGNNS